MNIIGQRSEQTVLNNDDIVGIVNQSADAIKPDGQKVLVVIPDYTRTCPLGQVVRAIHKAYSPRTSKLDFLIALGTHPAMTENQIDDMLDIEYGKRPEVLPGSEVFNHEWQNPDALAHIGTLKADQINRITKGLFNIDIEVTINKRIFDYDKIIIAGPVFPHEVVGFSGGAKYFFPGICGEELLNFFHWLGAVTTLPKIIGCKNTTVRETLEAAADLVTVDNYLLGMVVKGHDLAGLYFGPTRDCWSQCVDHSNDLHITYCDKPFTSVLSQAPLMYDEMWTGGKCMYKMESVVADGGELIIYAPYISEISITHGKIIEEIGYHTLEYFTKQWDKFKDYPWGILAHSTHVRGIGTFENGVEKPRVQVTLATSIPEDLCKKINLGYRDPDSIDPSQWEGKEDEGKLYIPKAGEMLYKLKDPPHWARP